MMAFNSCAGMELLYKQEELNEDQWLLRHARNVTSISGEDGILEKIFEVISPANRWCVEFGAWDGKTYSNTYHLIQDREWSGVLIEADGKKYADLLATYQGNRRAVCLHCFVTFAGANSLDNLLKTSGIPKILICSRLISTGTITIFGTPLPNTHQESWSSNSIRPSPTTWSSSSPGT